MAIDQGGLQYRIDIQGNFATELAKFRTELQQARSSWAAFRQDLGRLGNQTDRAGRAIRRLGAAAREQTRFSLDAARAVDRQARSYTQLGQALRQITALNERSSLAQRQQATALREQETIVRRSVALERARAAALIRTTALLENQTRAEAQLAQARARNLSAGAGARRQLDTETSARERLAAAIQRQQAALSSQALAQSRTVTSGLDPAQLEEFNRRQAAAAQQSLLLSRQQSAAVSRFRAENEALIAAIQRVAAATAALTRVERARQSIQSRSIVLSSDGRRIIEGESEARLRAAAAAERQQLALARAQVESARLAAQERATQAATAQQAAAAQTRSRERAAELQREASVVRQFAAQNRQLIAAIQESAQATSTLTQAERARQETQRRGAALSAEGRRTLDAEAEARTRAAAAAERQQLALARTFAETSRLAAQERETGAATTTQAVEAQTRARERAVELRRQESQALATQTTQLRGQEDAIRRVTGAIERQIVAERQRLSLIQQAIASSASVRRGFIQEAAARERVALAAERQALADRAAASTAQNFAARAQALGLDPVELQRFNEKIRLQQQELELQGRLAASERARIQTATRTAAVQEQQAGSSERQQDALRRTAEASVSAQRAFNSEAAARERVTAAIRAQQVALRQQAFEETRIRQLGLDPQELDAFNERLAIRRREAALAAREAQAQAEREAAARGATSAIRDQNAAEKLRQTTVEGGTAASGRATRAFELEAAARRRVAAETRRQAIADRAAAIQAEQLATRRQAFGGAAIAQQFERDARARAQFEAQLEALRQQQILQQLQRNSSEFRRLNTAVNGTTTELRRFNRETRETPSRLNRISFTFRRLIGIMAAFTIARQVVQQFRNMISGAIEFNATIEQTQIGIAGLVQAAGTVRDGLGRAVTGQEGFTRAQEAASQQLRALQSDALETAGTFEQLAVAFQTAVAPGLQAGLTLDQIRQITVQISQAATGLGVAQDQLAEEIRSLLQGTITPRTTRIATALGISNDDIRRARELGDLAEFINRRFEAIARSGRELLTTFNTQLSNANEGFRRLLGLASTGFFRQLTELVSDFTDEIQKNLGDSIEPNADAIEAFEGFFDGLERGVNALRDSLRALDLGALGTALAAVGQTVGAVLATLGESLNTLVVLLQPTFAVFAGIANLVQRIVLVFNQLITSSDSFFATTVRTAGQAFILLRTFGFINRSLLGIVRSGIRLTFQLTKQVRLAAIMATRFFLAGANIKRLAQSLRLLTAPLLVLISVLAGIGSLAAPDFFDAVANKIGSVLGPAIKKLDDLLVKILGLPDAVEIGTSGLTSTITDSLNATRAEVDEIVDGILKELNRVRDEGIVDADLLNLPTDVANQLRTFRLRLFEVQNQEFELQQKQNQLLIAAKKLEEERRDVKEQIATATSAAAGQSTQEANTLQRISDLTGELVQKTKNRQILELGLLSIQKSLRENREGDPDRDETLGRALVGARRSLLEADKEIEEIQRRIADLRSGNAAKVQQEVEAQQKLQQLRARLAELDSAVPAQRELAAEIEREILRIRQQGIDLANQELINTSRQLTAARELEIIELRLRAGRALAQVQLGQSARPVEVDLVERRFALAQQTREAEQAITAQVRIVNNLLQQQIAAERNGENSRELSLALQKQINAETDKLTVLTAETTANLTAGRQELERFETLASSDFGGGIIEGLKDFRADSATLGIAGQEFAKGFLQGATKTISEGLVTDAIAAFTDSENYDWRDVARNLAIELSTALVQAVIEAGLAEVLGGTLRDTTGAASLQAAAASLKLALDSGTKTLTTGAATASTALSGAATAWGPVILGLKEAAASLGLAAAGAAAARAGGGRITSSRSAPSYSMPFRRAQSFARGGRAHGPDARDRVPVWARIGEWFIRPEAARMYGDRVMSLLNAGAFDPRLMRQMAMISRRRGKGSSKGPGFAAGGAVSRKTTTRQETPRQETPRVLVTSVQFHDEQTLDQALSAGQKSFVRHARINRAEMKASLGLSGRTGF